MALDDHQRDDVDDDDNNDDDDDDDEDGSFPASTSRCLTISKPRITSGLATLLLMYVSSAETDSEMNNE